MGEDELPNKIMPESESKQLMNDIGFKDIKITYRNHMEAVLLAKK